MLGMGQQAHLWLPQLGSAMTPVPPVPPAPDPVVELVELLPLPPLLLDASPLPLVFDAPPLPLPPASVAVVSPPLPPIPVAVVLASPFVALFVVAAVVLLPEAVLPVETELPVVLTASLLPPLVSLSFDFSVLPQPNADTSSKGRHRFLKRVMRSNLVERALSRARALQRNQGVWPSEPF